MLLGALRVLGEKNGSGRGLGTGSFPMNPKMAIFLKNSRFYGLGGASRQKGEEGVFFA